MSDHWLAWNVPNVIEHTFSVSLHCTIYSNSYVYCGRVKQINYSSKLSLKISNPKFMHAASHHTPRCVYTQIIPKYECEHQPSVWWVKHQISHCDSSVLHTTMQIIFQFRTKFNLNGDKIGYNANQTRFSLVLECYQMWNDEGVVHVRTVCIRTCTCVRVTSVRINDKVISFWMIRKHSSFYEPSPKTQWQILSLATGPSKISSTAINAHSPHSINHLDTAHLHHPHDSSSLFAASVCLFISLLVVCKR